jgi:hypothetical protein
MVRKIARLLSKGVPMAVLCRRKGMPSMHAVRNWRNADPKVEALLARAREDGFDVIACDCLKIADDGARDYKKTLEGFAKVDKDHIQRSRLRVDTRLKLLKIWDPKRYGELLKLGDPEGGAIVPPAITLNGVLAARKAKAKVK